MVTTKISQSYFRCVELFIHKILSSYQVYRRKYSRLFFFVHLSFLTSHNLLFFSLCKSSKKTTFSVFLSFFLVKLSKSRSLKLNISRTAWPILMILVTFCRILNGRSDEINLFWRCSSPLTWINIKNVCLCIPVSRCVYIPYWLLPTSVRYLGKLGKTGKLILLPQRFFERFSQTLTPLPRNLPIRNLQLG